MVESAQQRLIVLVGADDWAEAGRAADDYLAVLAPHENLLQADEQIAQQPQQDWLALFQQHRLVLVTPGDEAALRSQAQPYWVDTALAKLYSPFGGVKPGAWQGRSVRLIRRVGSSAHAGDAGAATRRPTVCQ